MHANTRGLSFRSSALISCAIVALCVASPLVVHAAPSTIITQNTTLAAGEYFFDSLTIASSSTLTLQGDPDATTAFKGVIIHANNLTIEPGSRISADGMGVEGLETLTQFSVLNPTDLGIGRSYPGGGAMQLLVSDTLTNDGSISANGAWEANGGSILVDTHAFVGNGTFVARGGQFSGKGGRIMIRYAESSFTGTLDVSAQCSGPDYSRSCAEAGTAGFINTTTNSLVLPYDWRFQTSDAPFSFSNIIISGGTITSDPGVSISTNNLSLSAQSSVSFGNDVHLDAQNISLDGASTMGFSGTTQTNIGNLTVSGGSKVTTANMKALDLSLSNLTISNDSRIDAYAKGYPEMQGPGAPMLGDYAGASYGGIGYGNTATSTYGDANNPTDFGSGASEAGGGVISLTVSGAFTNDGVISTDGWSSASGGSILVHTHQLSGSGTFSANGGGKNTTSYLHPGGGGRVALYSDNSSFTGIVRANGACNYMYGYLKYCAGDGTVVIGNNAPKVSNVLFLPGIEGSRLYYRDIIGLGIGIEHQVWEPDFHTDIQYLAMNADGTSKYQLYTKDKDVIDTLYGNNVAESVAAKLKLGEEGVQVYGDLEHFMDALVDNGDVKEWRAYPYDWRYDVRDIVQDGTLTKMPDNTIQRVYLKDVLEEMAANSPSGKVTIVAHSNGGLLAKALAISLGADASEYIDRIIMVGTPQWGTPSSIGVMLHGDDQTLGLGLIMQGDEVRAATKTLPGAYGLLPSPAYFSHISDPVVTFDSTGFFSGKFATSFGSALSSFTALKNFLTDSAGLDAQVGSATDLRTPLALSSSLVGKAAVTHSVLDTWTPPADITVTAIAGWGQDTVKALAYTTGSKTVCKNLLTTSVCSSAPVLSHVPPVTTQDGDGTVLSPSAVGEVGAGLYFDSLLFEKDGNEKIIHQNLTSSLPIQNVIKDLLASKNPTAEPYIVTAKPTGGTNPIKLRASTHSPVNLVVTDANGKQSGVLPIPGTDFSGIKRDIPGSSVQVFDDEQYVNVPQGGTYQISMSGYAGGSATLDIDTIGSDGTVTATTTFANIPTTASSTATLSVVNGEPETLAVDMSGDGTTDFTAIPVSKNTDPLEYVRYIRSAIRALSLAGNMSQVLDAQLANVERKLALCEADKNHGNKFLCKYKTAAIVAELDSLKHHVESQVRLAALVRPPRIDRVGIPAATAEIIIGMINQLEALL